MIRWSWPEAALAFLAFYICGFATDWLHDFFFFSHTSMQDGIEVCDQFGGGDCTIEDNIRAYSSSGWAFAGNLTLIAFLVVRGTIALLIYVALEELSPRWAVRLLLLIPAAMCLIALWHMPYEFYRALRTAMLTCCAVLAVGGWRIGLRRVPAPLAILGIVFNPLFEFHMARGTWAIINVAAAFTLVSLAYADYLIGRAPDKAGWRQFRG